MVAFSHVEGGLRWAKIVPLVTLNWCPQALHLNSARLVYSYTATQAQRGQTGAPSVSAQRMARKVALASSSDSRATDATESVRARAERRKWEGIVSYPVV